MAVVRVEQITKKFGTLTAVDNVSFQVEEGEFFFLLGPSGAGKSTIFNLIAGILPLTSGDIHIGETLVNKLEPRQRNVAIAFESYALYPNRTVYGNIRFPLDAPVRKADYTEEEKDRIVRDMAALLQIGDLLDRYPRELSGGQRQRVALGRTLVRRPNVYLLDEPIAHLDAKLRHQMRRELKKLQKTLGIPAIFSTPDQSEAVAMADRIAVLDKGKIQQIGTSEELYFNPANDFVASTMGDPKISFVQGTLAREGEGLSLRTGEVSLPVPAVIAGEAEKRGIAGDVKVGIRYSDLKVATRKPSEPGYLEYTVDFFQINGEKLIITAKRNGVKLAVVRELERESRLRIGDPIWLKWESMNRYFFDPESGANLMAPAK
jgi:ABC-type sugar transport system ATPase subunit